VELERGGDVLIAVGKEALGKGDEDVACCTAEAERHPCSQNLAQRGRDAESDRKSDSWATVNGITVG
jgi:hypothetical protein